MTRFSCRGAAQAARERTEKSKNDATIEELSRLGIADGHNIIKGKQLFIPHYELGDLFGGCLSKGIIVVSPGYVLPIRVGHGWGAGQLLLIGTPRPVVRG